MSSGRQWPWTKKVLHLITTHGCRTPPPMKTPAVTLVPPYLYQARKKRILGRYGSQATTEVRLLRFRLTRSDKARSLLDVSGNTTLEHSWWSNDSNTNTNRVSHISLFWMVAEIQLAPHDIGIRWRQDRPFRDVESIQEFLFNSADTTWEALGRNPELFGAWARDIVGPLYSAAPLSLGQRLRNFLLPERNVAYWRHSP